MDGDASPLESFDRLAVQRLCDLAVAEQRLRPCLDPERPVRAGGTRAFLESFQSGGGLVVGAASGGGLDELGEREPVDAQVVVLARRSGAGERGVVATETVVQNCRRVPVPTDSSSLTSCGRVLEAPVHEVDRLGLDAAPDGK